MRSSDDRSQVLNSGASNSRPVVRPVAGGLLVALGGAGNRGPRGPARGQQWGQGVDRRPPVLGGQPVHAGTGPQQVVHGPKVHEAESFVAPDYPEDRHIADGDGLELPIDTRIGIVFRRHHGSVVPPEVLGREVRGQAVERADHRDLGEPSQEPIDQRHEAGQVDQPHDQ